MSSDRPAHEARQAELLAALIRGGAFPPGFSADQAEAASRSLRAKRARAVAAAWPALSAELGRDFPPRFDAYARMSAGPPPEGGGLADGLGFLAALDRTTSDAVRVEAGFVRALLARRCFLRVLRLGEPRRLLVVARAGRGRPRHFTIPLVTERRRRRSPAGPAHRD